MGETQDFTDRRHARQYRVAVPVELELGPGLTRDLSASGIFFETNLSCRVGATLSFSLVLEHADPNDPVRLHCQGKEVMSYEGLRHE